MSGKGFIAHEAYLTQQTEKTCLENWEPQCAEDLMEICPGNDLATCQMWWKEFLGSKLNFDQFWVDVLQYRQEA